MTTATEIGTIAADRGDGDDDEDDDVNGRRTIARERTSIKRAERRDRTVSAAVRNRQQ